MVHVCHFYVVDLCSTQFVQGVIIDHDTGAISVYNPLVITAGTTPAIAPTVPVLPVRHTIALWFGSNGNALRLGGPGLAHAACLNGIGTRVFQLSGCLPLWFDALLVCLSCLASNRYFFVLLCPVLFFPVMHYILLRWSVLTNGI